MLSFAHQLNMATTTRKPGKFLDVPFHDPCSLLGQLEAASIHAARIGAEKRRQQEEKAAREAQRKEANQRAWETRRDSGKFAATGLVGTVLERLPQGKENAITLAEVEARLADVPHAPSGVSSTLVSLINQGLAGRTGERRAYRYFKP